MKFSELDEYNGNRDEMDFIAALNSVDWTDHGYGEDVEVLELEKNGHDVFITFMDTRYYEQMKEIYRDGSGELTFEHDVESGDFAGVLNEAGIDVGP